MINTHQGNTNTHIVGAILNHAIRTNTRTRARPKSTILAATALAGRKTLGKYIFVTILPFPIKLPVDVASALAKKVHGTIAV